MKAKILLGAMAVLCASMVNVSCSQDASDMEPETWNLKPETSEVTLTFNPYDMESMTRAATSIAATMTRLDVWVYESGAEVTAVHQTSTDDGFGSISVTLDKTKTYTLYAVAHKASAAATLADGVISWTDDEVTHSMYYTTTFTPSETTSLNCLMNRIVAQFRLTITDDIPEAVKKLQFAITDVYDRWNVTTGGTHQVDQTSSVDYGTSKTFNVYAIVTDAATMHDITVTALDADNNAVSSQAARTFENVPLRNGYRTTYRGTFFIDTPTSASFTVEDWSAYDTVEF